MHGFLKNIIAERWGPLSEVEPEQHARWCFGGGGSPPAQTTTTVQKSDPWTGQQPYLKDVFAKAQENYNSTKPEYFPGSTVTGFTPAQQIAQGAGINRAINGNPLLPAAQNQNLATINGDYLNKGNPYTSELVQSVNNAIRPAVDSRFEASGRYGSAAHDAATTTALSNAIAPQLFGQYAQERQNQMGATAAAPDLANADYTDINALNQIGGVQQQQAQNERNAEIEKFNFNQNLPANKLAQYAQLVQGNFGGTQSGTSVTQGPSPGKGGGLAQGLGLGLQAIGTGAAAYTAFSDRRLKTDIEKIGKTTAGLPLYLYRYKWGGPAQIGVMAQDVEKKKPEAVIDVGGVKAVDYSKIN